MNRDPVKSSHILSIGYDLWSNDMEVEFKSGAVYRFESVPLSVYEELKAADSVGTYFDKNVKNNYAFRKVQ